MWTPVTCSPSRWTSSTGAWVWMVAGVGGVGGDESRRVDDRVRDVHHPLDVVGEIRHRLTSGLAGERLGWDPNVVAGVPFLLEVVGVVLGQLDEQPPGVADAGPGDIPQNLVLFEALLGPDAVGLRVPSAAVEQTMRAPGGPATEAAAFDQRHVDAAACEVTNGSSASGTATDDQYVCGERHAGS